MAKSPSPNGGSFVAGLAEHLAAKRSLTSAKGNVILDLDGEQVLYLKKFYRGSAPNGGYGFLNPIGAIIKALNT